MPIITPRLVQGGVLTVIVKFFQYLLNSLFDKCGYDLRHVLFPK